MLRGYHTTSYCFLFHSERGTRRGGADGQREAQEGAQAPDHLLQLPAGGAAEEVPDGPVPGPARAGRAGRSDGPHANAGEAQRHNYSRASAMPYTSENMANTLLFSAYEIFTLS